MMIRPDLIALSYGGSNMRRVIAVAIAGASLAGCSSFSWDMFKSAPASIAVQLESDPPGADARTSLGQGCKTPCSVSVPAPDTGFSVTYTLDKFQSQTVQVQVVHNPGDAANPATTVTEPNPVFAELQAAVPSPKASKPVRPKPKKPKPAAAAPAEVAFPDPNAAAPAPAAPSR